MFVASAVCFVWDTKPDFPSLYLPDLELDRELYLAQSEIR